MNSENEQLDLDAILGRATPTDQPMPQAVVVAESPAPAARVPPAPLARVVADQPRPRGGVPTPSDLLANFDATMTMCGMFAAATLMNAKDQNQAKAQVFLAVMRGAEMGMAPASSVSEIFVLPGKGGGPPRFVVSSRAIAGVLAARGIVVEPPVEEKRGQTCSVTVHRNGRSYTSLWTMTRAQQAGLADKDNWRSYPMEMLRARATAEACRMAAPDLLCGVYAPEEIDSTPAKTETAGLIEQLETGAQQ